MEDYMSKLQNTEFVQPHPPSSFKSVELAQNIGDDAWIEAAENCLLTKFDSLRILGGLPKNLPPLSRTELISRLSDLLSLWSDGCGHAIDERLFADVLARRRN
ncbi:hypothetical protein [Roseibium sp. TrichSKD4]|uniref:hypothetical protein n=1 Tax=Roseibium sp. TrichSKD4 TaxID=744980 RepID=UPI001AD93AEB|nr:hypothetical protein [Roseibium sp. TrichSKD4]